MKKLCYFLTTFLVLIDQTVKLLIVSNMKIYESIPIIKNFFSITYVRNDGAAFSILRHKSNFLILITFLVLLFLFLYIQKQKEMKKNEAICFGLLLSGILGNLIDRLLSGQVIDYFDFKIFGFNYPVFNLADCFIVIGILGMCFMIIRSDNCGSRGKRCKHKN